MLNKKCRKTAGMGMYITHMENRITHKWEFMRRRHSGRCEKRFDIGKMWW